MRLPQPHLRGVREIASALDYSDGVMIDVEAFRPGIAAGSGDQRLDLIEASEPVREGESSKGDGVQAYERAVVDDARAADGLLVLRAMLRKGLDEDVHTPHAVLAEAHGREGSPRGS